MNNWEKAVEKFIGKWERNKEVIGALVCGSFVTGNPTKHSDIDLHIILSDKVTWCERGNVIIDGFLIEYFCNSSKQIKKYFEEDYKEGTDMSFNQFLTGKIIFDKKDRIKDLKKIARKFKNKSFIKLDKTSIELQKYELWDNLDNTIDNSKKNSIDFYFIYYFTLKKIYNTYTKHLQYPFTSVDKTYMTLKSKEARTKYLMKDFPDKKFIKLFTNAIKKSRKSIMLNNLKLLTKHVHNKMGGFKINGWKLRTSVDV